MDKAAQTEQHDTATRPQTYEQQRASRQPKPTMSQVLHTSLLESHDEALNEISNLKHDYAIVSAERNNLKAHAERLAEALRTVLAATGGNWQDGQGWEKKAKLALELWEKLP